MFPQATAFDVLPDGTYTLDPTASAVRFSLAHFRVQTVRGSLTGLDGTVAVQDGALEARGSVDAASISTGTAARDAHLRTSLFAVERNPRITLTASGPLAREVPVTLWIRGRPVTVLAHLAGSAVLLQVRFVLDRRAAGLTWPAPIEAGGVAVGRKIAVEIDLALRAA